MGRRLSGAETAAGKCIELDRALSFGGKPDSPAAHAWSLISAQGPCVRDGAQPQPAIHGKRPSGRV